MNTECTQQSFEFQSLKRRKVKADFSGGRLTSDGGGLLLREVEKRIGLIEDLAKCFEDSRDPSRVEHTLEELLAQRIYGLALGYEDLNDHEELRQDPLLGILVEKADPTGETRQRSRDKGNALAGKSSLNRLELAGEGKGQERYKKIQVDEEQVARLFVEKFIESRRRRPRRLILDLDATDDLLHGEQEGRSFNSYYRGYCYLPLYAFCDGFPLWAQLRPSNIDASEGSVAALKIMMGMLRKKWPKVRILVRADSGFAREELMAWCESKGVDYIFGLARNSRLQEEISEQKERARAQFERTGKTARIFVEFEYRTLKSWSRSRRVIAKVEHLAKGENPRFLVTSLEKGKAKYLYEKVYCARGEMENRIKEQQLDLFADRTSTSYIRSNQLRLWFSTAAYLMLHQLRRLGLRGTKMARAQCGTIRLKLLKIGAQIRVSVRRFMLAFAGGYPYKRLFEQVYRNLQAQPLLN